MSPEAGTLLHTPLYDEHLRLGARMVPFAGWQMPVQYAGVIEEHNAVPRRVEELLVRVVEGTTRATVQNQNRNSGWVAPFGYPRITAC